MLVDLHANPGALSPEAFAQAVLESGLSGVVVARTHEAGDLTPWFEALEDLELAVFAGVELRLSKGSVVFVPEDWQGPFAEVDWTPPEGDAWTAQAITDRLAEVPGAVIASHPYCQAQGEVLGDRIYAIKGLAAVQTRAGRGLLRWDNMADGFAESRGLARVGTSGGDLAWLGRAATIVPDEVEDELELVAALRGGKTWPVEFDEADNRRDRTPPPSPERRERGGFGGRDRDGGRGGRGDRRGGGRGDRGDRRGGRGRDDRRGGGRREGGRGGRRNDRRGPRDDG